MRTKHEYPHMPGQGSGCRRGTGLALALLVSAGLALGGNAVHARGATSQPPPPASVYRWENTDTGLCGYDRGLNTIMNLGGCNSATRWTRTNCANRTAGGVTFFSCLYHSQATGGCMIRSTGSQAPYIVGDVGCVTIDEEFFGDPGSGTSPGAVLNLWDMGHGHVPNVMQANGNGMGASLLSEPIGTFPQYHWALLPG